MIEKKEFSSCLSFYEKKIESCAKISTGHMITENNCHVIS